MRVATVLAFLAPFLACALLPASAEAISVIPTPPALPCTLLVFDDETYVGCDGVVPDSAGGDLLSSAGEHAIVMMRAWRKRKADAVFFENLMIDSDTREGPYFRRDEARRVLQGHFAETVSIDSMVVEIFADSAALGSGVVHVRFWVARAVPRGKGTISQIDRLEYRQSWLRTSGTPPWVLLGFDETAQNVWTIEESRAGGTIFPVRPPPDDVEIGNLDSEQEGSVEPSSRRDLVDWTVPPTTLAVGAEVGPFTAGCLRDPLLSPFVVTVEEPVPTITVRPRYPEIAREGGISGKVRLHVYVCEDGRVGWIRVASGHPVLNAAAAVAISQWEFLPAKSAGGRPVGAWREVPVDFHR
jgi:TonB family protein